MIDKDLIRIRTWAETRGLYEKVIQWYNMLNYKKKLVSLLKLY